MFLTTLLDGYIDIEATRERIAERAGSALTVGREAVADDWAELSKADARARPHQARMA